MNYLERRFARQMLLWERIAHLGTKAAEEETQRAQRDGGRGERPAEDAWLSAAAEAAETDGAAAQETAGSKMRRAAALSQEDGEWEALCAALSAAGAARQEGLKRADDAPSAGRQEPRWGSGGTEAAAPREAMAQLPLGEESAASPRAVSRFLERDCRRYDAGFALYE